MRRGAFSLIIISVFLGALGCGERKSFNPDILDKNAVQAFRSDYQEVKAALADARIQLVEETNEEDELLQFYAKPDDLSRIPEVRIAALEKFAGFIDNSLNTYFGKKHLHNKKMRYLISETTKSTFDKSKASANELIRHYGSVKYLRLEPNFTEHDEYQKIAGETLKSLTEMTNVFREKYGVDVSPSVVELNELMPLDPQLVFTENSFVESQSAAVTDLSSQMKKVKEALQLLEGRLVVVDINHFVTYDESHIKRVAPLQDDLKSYRALIKKYQTDLKEVADTPLAKAAKLKIDRKSNGEGPSLSDRKTYFRINLKSAFQNATDLDYRVYAEAFVDYRDNLNRFMKSYEGKSEKNGRVQMTFLNGGEKAILGSGFDSADLWARFFIKAGASDDGARIATFGELYFNHLKPLREKQIKLRNSLSESGIFVPAELPISKFKWNGTDYARDIFKMYFRIDVTSADQLKKNPQPLRDFYCFMKNDFMQFLKPLASSAKKFHLSPEESFSYGSKELQRASTALTMIEDVLRTHDSIPKCEPQPE